MESEGSWSARSCCSVIVGCTALFAIHALLTFLLYRERRLNGWSLTNSDLVVFGAPTIAAAAAMFFLLYASPLLRRAAAMRRLIVIILISLLLAIFSLCLSMITPFNAFGT